MATLIETLIPFLFILAVVYGSLEVSKVFQRSAVKGLIAVSIALVTMTSEAVVSFVSEILPYAAMIFVAFFVLSFIFNAFKGEDKKTIDWQIIAIIAILVLLFLTTQQELVEHFLPGLTAENTIIAVAGIMIVVIFFAAYKKGGFMGDGK